MQQWATALVGYRGLRSELLIELKKAQPLTAKELGARFGLTANALRRHLKELEGAGLVRYRREVRGVGGPRFAYSLSEEGEALFPRAHAATLVEALEFLREREGPEAVVAFFRQRWAGIITEAGLDLPSLAFADRVQLFAELLTSQGYMAEAVADAPAAGGREPAGSAMTLRKYNCALREVAERFPELCDAEVEFMERVLGARLDRRAHLLAGCNMCEYRVVEQTGRSSSSSSSSSSRTAGISGRSTSVAAPSDLEQHSEIHQEKA
jgi:DeoR family suf operon transcriptional repressor